MLADIAPDIHPLTNAPLLMPVLKILKCPSCGVSRFEIHRDESTQLDTQTHCVVVCEECKTCFKYENGILEMLLEKPYGLTPAQKSNFLGLIADRYQSGWRSWCMNLFYGSKFTNEMEAEKIIRMMDFDTLPPDPIFVDAGTSHGFYAIAVAKKLQKMNSDGFVIAIDFSKKMLSNAVTAAEKNCVSDKILWMLADVEDPPIADQSVDRVSCGGSLNEYRRPEKAVAETARVLKNGGRYVTMNLFSRNKTLAFFLSIVHMVSGLSFFKKDVWNKIFTDKGLRIVEQETRGMVIFTVSMK
jgi:ubiquinone/menaquinone biosynthesis C-methylase UbiE/uncharacterized protein YbaR (Trm112 family)